MSAVRSLGRGRLALLGGGLLAVAAVGVHTLLWRWAEQRLQDGFEVWAADRRAQGWTVRAGDPVAAGWPLAAKLVLKQVVLAGAQADIPDGFAWDAERVTLSIALAKPRLLSIHPEGAQRLRIASWPQIPYTADRLRVEVPLDPGAPPHEALLSAIALRVGVPIGRGSPAPLTSDALRLRVELHPAATEGEPALAFAWRADAIGLPPGFPSGLGGHIESLEMEGALNGPVPRMPGLARRATAWRDGGGTLEVQRMNVDWGPLVLTGSATLALDPKLQPMGAGTARIVGYSQALDALGASGTIPPRAAFAAKALAGLVAASPERGGPPEIEVPLTLQDRALAIRQFPLTRIPALAWPPG